MEAVTFTYEDSELEGLESFSAEQNPVLYSKDAEIPQNPEDKSNIVAIAAISYLLLKLDARVFSDLKEKPMLNAIDLVTEFIKDNKANLSASQSEAAAKRLELLTNKLAALRADFIKSQKSFINDTIFKVNALGRLKRAKKLKKYLKYVTKRDAKVRPSHRLLEGKTYPADSEFWKTHTPPLGRNCRCVLRVVDPPAEELLDSSNSEPRRAATAQAAAEPDVDPSSSNTLFKYKNHLNKVLKHKANEAKSKYLDLELEVPALIKNML